MLMHTLESQVTNDQVEEQFHVEFDTDIREVYDLPDDEILAILGEIIWNQDICVFIRWVCTRNYLEIYLEEDEGLRFLVNEFCADYTHNYVVNILLEDVIRELKLHDVTELLVLHSEHRIKY